MGNKPRIALLLAATSCLLAVMIDWILEELRRPRRVAVAIPVPEPVAVVPE
jgi:hypothetical protein